MNPAAELVPTGLEGVPEGDDPLAEALHYLRMDGMFYCRSELTAPWGLELPAMPDCLWFHVVTEGECLLIDSNDRQLRLRAGDIAVLPHGAGHRAADAAETPTPIVFDLPHTYLSRQYAILRHGGGGSESCSVICGVVHLGHPAARLLLDALPEVIHVDSVTQRSEWQWLPGVLALMAAEARTTQPGGETVITRLSDVLVIQAIRFWIDNDPGARTGWLNALRDPLIGRAIAAIHRDPARGWTVAALASTAAMSRSAFAARFTELVGQPPKQYLTQWRMHLATDLLRDGDTRIFDIATRLGYHSEAAFSRAFTRETGIAPSRVRGRPDIVSMAIERATH